MGEGAAWFSEYRDVASQWHLGKDSVAFTDCKSVEVSGVVFGCVHTLERGVLHG